MNINVFSATQIKLVNFFIVFVASYFLFGCNDKPQSKLPKKTASKSYAVATTLKGSVIGKDGPIESGTVKVTGDTGTVISSTKLQNNKHYSVTIPAGTSLPILLKFYSEPGQAESEIMFTAVIFPTMTQFDITPLTTAIAKKAKAMGGYTHTNMITAAKNSVSMPKSNQTTGGFSGDPTKQYGGWH